MTPSGRLAFLELLCVYFARLTSKPEPAKPEANSLLLGRLAGISISPACCRGSGLAKPAEPAEPAKLGRPLRLTGEQ